MAELLKKFNIKGGMPFIIVGIAAGLILILISFLPSGSKGGSSGPSGLADKLSSADTDAYAALLEGKLASLIEGIPGLSGVRVMVALSSSGEYIYASKQSVKQGASDGKGSASKDQSTELILAGDGKGSQYPILAKEVAPKVGGVAVVCRGADASKKLEVVNLISSLLGLPSNKIYVYGG